MIVRSNDAGSPEMLDRLYAHAKPLAQNILLVEPERRSDPAHRTRRFRKTRGNPLHGGTAVFLGLHVDDGPGAMPSERTASRSCS